MSKFSRVLQADRPPVSTLYGGCEISNPIFGDPKIAFEEVIAKLAMHDAGSKIEKQTIAFATYSGNIAVSAETETVVADSIPLTLLAADQLVA